MKSKKLFRARAILPVALGPLKFIGAIAKGRLFMTDDEENFYYISSTAGDKCQLPIGISKVHWLAASLCPRLSVSCLISPRLHALHSHSVSPWTTADPSFTDASPSTSRMLLEKCKRTCRMKKRREITGGKWLSLVAFYALVFLATSITVLQEMS